MTDSGLRRRKIDGGGVKTSHENVKPTPKTAGWTVFAQVFVVLLTVPILYVTYVFAFVAAPFEVREITLPDPPAFVGVLEPNTDLQKTEKLFLNQLNGPEAIVFDHGHIYTGDYNGKVLHIERGVINTVATFGEPPCGTLENEPNCGRPLGLRLDSEKYLVVLDAYKGMFRVNPVTGDSHQYFSADVKMDGETPKFLNDLDVASDGSIYLTDSSTKWSRNQLPPIFLEGDNTGRLIKYNPSSNATEVLIRGLHFANGVQLSRNEEYVLVAETTTARIIKYYLKGPKSGKIEYFAENLPCFPDNIRLARSGGYWVGCALMRSSDRFSLMDFMLKRPQLRLFLAKAVPPKLMEFVAGRSRGAIVLQMNDNGEITRSLQDPTAAVIESVSSVEDNNGVLYFGSYKAPFIGKLKVPAL